MTKTTKADFALFKKECRRWLVKFGLVGWDVAFEHKDCDGSCATAALNASQHYAVITLGTDMAGYNFYGKESIKAWAFHEVCHVLFADYSDLAQRREYSASEHDRVEHAIIVTLENVLYANEKK